MQWSTLDMWQPLLTLEEREYLASRSSTVTYEPGVTILHQGDPPEFVLYLSKGYVYAVSPVTGLIASIRRPGDIVGEIGPVSREPRSTDVVSKTFVEAMLVPATVWIDFISTHPRALGAHYLALAKRFADEDVFRGERVKGSEERVIHAIGKLLETDMGEPRRDGLVFKNTTQTELGNMVGLSRESVSNVLRNLKAQGLVSTSRGSIIVHAPDEIKRLARQQRTHGEGDERHVEP